MLRRWVKLYLTNPESLENKKKPGEESIKYPNLINGNWNTNKPLEKVFADTTMIWFKKQSYDWTYYVDVFNYEIIGSNVKSFLHCSNLINHKLALESILENKIKRGYESQDTIMHSDQGIIESKNGWLKKEMYIDFDINNYNTVQEFIDDIVWDNNNFRPSFALQYKNPVEYRTQLGFN